MEDIANDELTKIINEIQEKIDATAEICGTSSKELNQNIDSRAKAKKMKLLFVSTSVNQTNGYSKVTYNILNRLQAQLPWLDIVHFAIQGLGHNGVVQGVQEQQGQQGQTDVGRILNSKIQVINGSALEKKQQGGFAFSELPGVIKSVQPDIVMFYNDISVICAYLEEIRKANISDCGYKVWAFIDTLYSNYNQNMLDIINRDVSHIFCFTRQWMNVLKKHGINRPMSILYHGIDENSIKRIDKDIARQSVGLPKNAFIFTSFNRNHPRKRYDIMIMAFVDLIIRHPTKPIFLMIVADKGSRGGYPLFDIFARELKLRGVGTEMYGNRLLITATDNTIFKDSDINLLYNIADAGVSCSEAEGWGLCPFEQLYLGIPQIVPNIHGFNEYCNSENSILVEPSSRYYLPLSYSPMCGEGKSISCSDLCNAMERVVVDNELRSRLNAGALTSMRNDKYKWDNCIKELVRLINSEAEDKSKETETEK